MIFHNAILHNEVEMGAPSDPVESLEYYAEQRVEALLSEPIDWEKYNLCGRRLLGLLQERGQ